MTYSIEIKESAWSDLKEIYNYIAGELMEPATAKAQYLRIEKAIFSLDSMPERCRRYEKDPWKSRNLRVMPVDNYIVFYLVDNENKTVTVIRIMYGRQNTEKELDDMER